MTVSEIETAFEIDHELIKSLANPLCHRENAK